MRVLITGNKGFIGSYLWKILEEEGYELCGYDLQDGYDLCDKEGMDTVFKRFRPECVASLAAQAYVPPGEKDPVQNAITNVAGTVNVMENARKVGAKVIFTSSGAAYGTLSTIPVHEKLECHPESQYGVSKLAAERYALFYYEKRDLPVTITRFSSVYGYGRRFGPINNFVEKVMNDEEIIIYGDGEQTRDFTYVDDVVVGLMLCVTERIPFFGQIYNIASGIGTTVNRVIEQIERVTGKKANIKHQPPVKGDIRENYFDVSAAEYFGYKAKVSIEEGIEKLVEEYRKT